MIRRLVLAAVPLAALVAAPAAAQGANVDQAVAALYAHYALANPNWDEILAIKKYSAATEALITEWERNLPQDEVTDLADFDWLCECQDWDSANFKLTIAPHPAPQDGKAEVVARVYIGWDTEREQRFIVVEEAGAWKVDDLFSESFPNGLKAGLREATAKLRTE